MEQALVCTTVMPKQISVAARLYKECFTLLVGKEDTSSNIQYGAFEGTAHVHNIVCIILGYNLASSIILV